MNRYYIVDSAGHVRETAESKEEAERLLRKKYGPKYIEKMGLRIVRAGWNN